MGVKIRSSRCGAIGAVIIVRDGPAARPSHEIG
jgi:hypothetical protein